MNRLSRHHRIPVLFRLAAAALAVTLGTAAMAATVTVPLTRGVNVVCIPAVPASTSVPELFREIESKVVRIDAFDSDSGQWQTYFPDLPAGGTLESLPGGTGFVVEVSTDCQLSVVGVDPAADEPAAFFPTRLKCGWNLTGVRQTMSLRNLAAARLTAKCCDFVLESDTVYRFSKAADGSGTFVQLTADDQLQPGQGYWFNTDPDGDSVASAQEIWDQNGNPKAGATSATVADTSPSGTAGAAADSGRTATQPAETGEAAADQLVFGPFTVTLTQLFRNDEGLPVRATGRITAWPAGLRGLIEPAATPANLTVEVLYYSAAPQSAYCPHPGAMKLGGNTAIAGENIAFLSIAKAGHLLLGCKLTEANPACTYSGVVKWFNLDDPDIDVLQKEKYQNGPLKNRSWVQFTVPLNDETTVSRFWQRAAGGDVTPYQVDNRTWFLRMPELSAGVFDVSTAAGPVSADKYDFGKWLPVDAAGNGTEPAFTGTAQAKYMQALIPGGIAAFASAADASIRVDAEGRISTVDNGNLFRYQNGTLDIAPNNSFFHVGFRGFRGVPTFTMGDTEAEFTDSAIWNPSLTLSLTYEDDALKVSGGVELDASIVLHIASGDDKEGLAEKLGRLASLLVDKIKKQPPQQSGGSTDASMTALFEGTSLHLKPSFLITYKTGRDESRDFALDFNVSADLGAAFLAGTPARYGHEFAFTAGLTLNNIPYVGNIGFSLKRESSWFSDAFVGGTEDGFEDKILLRGGVTLNTAMMGSDSWKMEIGGDWRTALTYTGMGSYTPAGSSAAVNAKEYKVEQVVTGEAMAGANNQTLDDDGWEFGVRSLRFEFDPAMVHGNSFKDVVLDYGRNFRNSFSTLRRVVGDATLKPPEDLDWLPALDATVVWERLNAANPPDPKDGTPYRLAIIADTNIELPVGEFTFRIRNLLYATDSVAKSRTVMAGCDFDFRDKHVEAILLIQKVDGKWKILVDTRGIPLGDNVTIQDALLSFTYDPAKKDKPFKERFSDVTVNVGVRVTHNDLKEMGYPEGFFASGTYHDGDVLVQLQNVPLTLQQNLPDCGVQFEKIRNILLARYRDGRLQFQFEIDAIFSSFVDDQSKPREQWPRATFGMAVGLLPKKADENKPIGDRLDFTAYCKTIGPINCGDGATLTLNEVGVGRLATGIWRVFGGATLHTPDGWRNSSFSRDVVSVPENITGTFELAKAMADKILFKAAFKWDPAPIIRLGGEDTQLKFTQFTFTKASPWGFGIDTEVSLWGQVTNGTVGTKDGGFFVGLPAETTINLDLSGGFHLAVSKLRLQLGNDTAVAGDVQLTIPDGSPLRSIFGATVQATMSGTPSRFQIKAALGLDATIDFGELGTGELALNSLSLDTTGSFAADGRLGFNDANVAFEIAYLTGNYSFMVDFGDRGVSLNLASLFDFQIRKKFGIATLFGMQYVRLDDMALDVGNDIAGAGLAVKRLYYFLPSSVPPIGFPFFDDVSGNLRVVGFKVNAGMLFPAPNENDAKILFQVIAKGIGGHYDPAPLRQLSAPAFGLHDIYVAFPQVPGYTFKNGSFQSTDNVFADIFGSNRLDIIRELSMKPATMYDLATAKSPFDVAKALIPHDKRHGSLNLNLRGFSASGSYDLRETDLSKYRPLVPKMTELAAYVSKVRYVDGNTPDFPAVLSINRGSKLLHAWGAGDTGLQHEIGKADALSALPLRVRNFVVNVAGAPETVSRNLSDAAYAAALVQALLERPSAPAPLAVYPDGGKWVVNPFDSRCRDFYAAQSVNAQDEAAALGALLGKGLSRGTVVDYLLAYDDFRGRQLTMLENADAARQGAFVRNVIQQLTGIAAVDAVADAWVKSLQPSATWTSSPEEKGALAVTPAVRLPPGYYKAAVSVKSADNTGTADAVVIDLLLGGNVRGSQHFRGKDFAFPDSWQLVYMPFTLTEDADVALRVAAGGSAAVSVKDLFLFSAIKAQDSTMALPDNLGGGNAQVRWDVLDMTDEMTRVLEFVQFLRPPQDKPWDQYLPALWTRLAQRGGVPEFRANQALFDYSVQIQVQLDLLATADGYQPSTLKLNAQQPMARFGDVVFYDVPSNNPEDGMLVTEDMANLGDQTASGRTFGDNCLSGVTVTAGGKAVIYRDAGFQGPRAQAEANIATMADTDIGDNQASSVQVWFPLDLADLAHWRVTARTLGGTILTMDAGGIEILFPGDPSNLRVLTMLPGSRMAQAYAQLRTLAANLKPADIFGNPQRFLQDSWRKELLPLKAAAESDGCAVSFRAGEGLVHKLEIYKVAKNKTTGVVFEGATETLYAKQGTAKLFPNANFSGSAVEIVRDIVDLRSSAFSRTPPRSAALEEGAVLTFYPEPHFGDFVPAQTWAAGTDASLHTPLGEAVPEQGWGVNYLRPLNATADRRLTKGPGVRLEAGYYKLAVEVRRDVPQRPTQDGSGNPVLAQFQPAPLGLVSYEEDAGQPLLGIAVKAIAPYKADLITRTVARSDVEPGQWQSVELTFDLQEPTTVDIYVDALADTTPHAIRKYQLHRLQPGLNPEPIDSTRSALPERKRGSVRAMQPIAITDATSWVLSHQYPSGLNLAIAHGEVQTGSSSTGDSAPAENDTRVACTLKYSDNQILLNRSAEGTTFELVPRAASGYQYPAADYYVYTKTQPDAVSNLQNTAAAYRQYIRKVITVTQNGVETPATVTPQGGITATCSGVDITAQNACSKYSSLYLDSDFGHHLCLPLSPGSDFNSARILSTTPAQTVPTYANKNGEPIGIAIPIPESEKGGLFVNVALSAGSASVVRLDVAVAGAIKEDGGFYLKGNGDLIINNFTVSEAEICIGSEEGLYVRGTIDLFTLARAEVEGYIRPDGQFLLRGSAAIMRNGTGIQGAFNFNQHEFAIFGGVYVANHRLKSANFTIADGRLSYHEDMSIGFAGFEYTVWVLFKNPYGAGVDGDAYLEVDIPVKIWGPTGWSRIRIWLPFRKRTISIPTSWGWIEVARIRTHFDITVHLAVTGEAVRFGLGPCTLAYNFPRRNLSVSW